MSSINVYILIIAIVMMADNLVKSQSVNFTDCVTNTSKLFEVIKGVIRGREMPFPQQQIDPCNSGNIFPSCPLKKDEHYQFKAWFEVKPYYPPISLKVSYTLTDPIGQKIACVQVATKIVDPRKKNLKSNQPNRSMRNRMKKNRQKKLEKP
ncbi:Phosphatidylglycerol/phosphatidylinositol transfer protein [Dermatophagoides pteronyssinus]|uniref:Phosphatidylglycerol/phosphatidylinositol transfer protein n=1 Tax=Dermatophagoides pteronyssinus TaxID=6956 RepID=A0ABQ8JHM3_DERPT|nr:Phosphatidylglycerol/phosphatidylinositol transfer protein [Dermatophagoides pteronyssinus]